MTVSAQNYNYSFSPTTSMPHGLPGRAIACPIREPGVSPTQTIWATDADEQHEPSSRWDNGCPRHPQPTSMRTPLPPRHKLAALESYLAASGVHCCVSAAPHKASALPSGWFCVLSSLYKSTRKSFAKLNQYVSLSLECMNRYVRAKGKEFYMPFLFFSASDD